MCYYIVTQLEDCGLLDMTVIKILFSFHLRRDGHSVLVHGYEGTDCTLLVSTLAQLIMDPCCRTLEGFLALLEREWVQVSVHGNSRWTGYKISTDVVQVSGRAKFHFLRFQIFAIYATQSKLYSSPLLPS